MDLHVAHGGDAVEPGVGGAVAQVLEALLGAGAQQRVSPPGLLRGQGAPAHRRGAGGLGALGHAVEPHAGLDAGDELVAGPDAVVLDGGIVHGGLSFPGGSWLAQTDGVIVLQLGKQTCSELSKVGVDVAFALQLFALAQI